ncbi:MAG: hypothetical protein K1X67_11840 [Fimbriimonadaceae bacterium]|nr:hypothetical protein [Fimbriimonadaceae bacterium]
MNIRNFAFALTALLLFALSVPSYGQVTADERAKKADEILKKVHQLDLMNNLLPLVLTKEQLGKFLPVMEKARQSVREQEKIEYDFLMKLNPKVDSALTDAKTKGKVPGREVINETWATFSMFTMRRKAIADENVANVMKAFEGAINDGQRKTAINTVNPKQFDPTADPKTMSDAKKMEMFVRNILLDPAAYDLLVGMLK